MSTQAGVGEDDEDDDDDDVGGGCATHLLIIPPWKWSLGRAMLMSRRLYFPT